MSAQGPGQDNVGIVLEGVGHTLTQTQTHTISQQALRDLLCTAVEGGSTYWAGFMRPMADPVSGECYVSVTVYAAMEGDFATRVVTADGLMRGLQALVVAAEDTETFPAAAQHLADVLQGDADAGTADVVLQLTMFGEVMFG